MTRLFNPRIDIYSEHFDWSDSVLLGKTNIAAATVGLLRINSDSRVSHRRLLIKCNLFPPKIDDY